MPGFPGEKTLARSESVRQVNVTFKVSRSLVLSLKKTGSKKRVMQFSTTGLLVISAVGKKKEKKEKKELASRTTDYTTSCFPLTFKSPVVNPLSDLDFSGKKRIGPAVCTLQLKHLVPASC